jgi:hypothetical protein
MWAERGKAAPAAVSQKGLRATCRGREGTAAVTGVRRGVVVVAALALAACTNGSASSATSSATATTPRTATLPAPSSPSPTATTDPATAAKAAYLRYRQIVDRAYQSPTRANRDQIAKVAAGGRLTFLLAQIDELSGDKVRQQGRVLVKSVEVTSTSPASGNQLAQAFLDGCLDFRGRVYINADGTPRFAGDQAKGGYSRTRANMIFDRGAWLVVDEDLDTVKSC